VQVAHFDTIGCLIPSQLERHVSLPARFAGRWPLRSYFAAPWEARFPTRIRPNSSGVSLTFYPSYRPMILDLSPLLPHASAPSLATAYRNSIPAASRSASLQSLARCHRDAQSSAAAR
jgi:hypothetical protein